MLILNYFGTDPVFVKGAAVFDTNLIAAVPTLSQHATVHTGSQLPECIRRQAWAAITQARREVALRLAPESTTTPTPHLQVNCPVWAANQCMSVFVGRALSE